MESRLKLQFLDTVGDVIALIGIGWLTWHSIWIFLLPSFGLPNPAMHPIIGTFQDNPNPYILGSALAIAMIIGVSTRHPWVLIFATFFYSIVIAPIAVLALLVGSIQIGFMYAGFAIFSLGISSCIFVGYKRYAHH